MAKNRLPDPALLDSIDQLVAAGWSYTAIGAELGISRHTAIRYNKNHRLMSMDDDPQIELAPYERRQLLQQAAWLAGILRGLGTLQHYTGNDLTTAIDIATQRHGPIQDGQELRREVGKRLGQMFALEPSTILDTSFHREAVLARKRAAAGGFNQKPSGLKKISS